MRHALTWLTVAYPLTAHGLILADRTAWVVYVLALLALIQGLLAVKFRRWGGFVLGLCVLAACGADLASSRTNAMYLPPIIVSGLFLTLFGGTLLPGREPLITRFARVLMHDNDATTRRYTRKVTQLWTIFFALQLLENTVLALFAPVEVWSLFANVLNYVMIAAVFAGELMYRLLALRSHSAGRFFTAMRRADFAALVRDPR